MQQVHVDKVHLAEAKLVAPDQPALADGSVRLAVESFSVTANNITYAVMGDSFGYWNFFPAPEGKGIVPVWGHARVIESRHPQFSPGERLYGYLPMATHFDVEPGRLAEGTFVDTAAHRQPMSPIYNQYTRLSADPEHDPAREGERMIFGPLFKTGFLIEYFLRNENWFGAEQVILSSASSKTAMGLASVARRNSPHIRRIGVTSAANVEFVKGCGLYDAVISYDAIGQIELRSSVTVDFAGNAKVLGELHRHLNDCLRYSCLVGATHIEERSAQSWEADELPGPKPTLFFAPDHAFSLFREHGPEKAGALMAESWRGFLEDAGSSINIVRLKGLEAARKVFVSMVHGDVDPASGIIIEP